MKSFNTHLKRKCLDRQLDTLDVQRKKIQKSICQLDLIDKIKSLEESKLTLLEIEGANSVTSDIYPFLETFFKKAKWTTLKIKYKLKAYAAEIEGAGYVGPVSYESIRADIDIPSENALKPYILQSKMDIEKLVELDESQKEEFIEITSKQMNLLGFYNVVSSIDGKCTTDKIFGEYEFRMRYWIKK
jgi:hypothetical protein